MQDCNHYLAYCLKIIDEHCVAQDLLRLIISTSFWLVLPLKSLNSNIFLILCTAYSLKQD